MRFYLKAAAAMVVVSLAACTEDRGQAGGSGGSAPPAAGGAAKACKVAATESRAGAQQAVVLESRVDGLAVSFEVFEPDALVAGKTYPLVLHGHGYGGARQVTRDGFVARLTAAGYYVISIDQRGFGDAGGTVRVLSPDFEGQDIVQIVDWAEDLPGVACNSSGNMLLGSYGGSYGGGYQLMLLGMDPRQRLDALAPDITWHDLTYSLQPHDVVKSGYGLALSAVGESGGQSNPDPQGGQDPLIYETLVQSTIQNRFSDASFNLFRYHSPKYHCDGLPAGPQAFMVATPDPLGVPAMQQPKADILLTQGFRDTLFNFNEAFWNYECLKASGGDVRLLTHQSGHILPVSASQGGLEDALDPFYAAVTAPNFQDVAGSRSCGSMSLDDVQFAWFEAKLKGNKAALTAALKTGTNTCLSLAEGDAIEVAAVTVGGIAFPLDAATTQFSSALGVAGATLGNGAREALAATIPLYTAPSGGAVVAGIPTIDLQLAGLSGLELGECPTPLGVAGCDPILFLAVGHRKAGTERWDVIDDQLTPVRSFGTHQAQMGGIAERLAEGDQLALLVYAFHAQFPVTWSRDLLVPAVDMTGSVSLPILGPGQILREGV